MDGALEKQGKRRKAHPVRQRCGFALPAAVCAARKKRDRPGHTGNGKVYESREETMKNRFSSKLTAAVCALALSLSLVPAASAAESPTKSSNINKQDYTTYGSTVKSYLYENEDGGLTRVEYINGTIVVEDYDSAFTLQSSRTVPMELSIWGGFYAGEDCNFLFFGQNNEEEDDQKEVIRVVKYSKDWQRMGQASLKGANTIHPFDAGSLRCDEYGGYLYVRTCHEMYTSSDGLNHQSNLTMAVRESDLSITDSYYDVMNSSYGYISHSFNQFIIVDEAGKIVALDHGDAYPRGVAFSKYYADAGTGKFTGGAYSNWCSSGVMMEFAGSVGQNTTGASVGGLAETSDCYIMAYNYDGAGGRGDRYPYYHWMDKASGRSWSAKLTNTPGSTTPVLAPIGLGGGYMLWNGKSGYTANDTLYYLQYGADGKPGETKTATAPLSDCQPISYNGKAVWYVTNNSAPTFYTLDGSGVESHPAGGDPTPTAPAATTTTPDAPTTTTAPGSSSTSSQKNGGKYQMGEMVEIGDPNCKHYFVYSNPHETIDSTCTDEGYVILICPYCGAKQVYGITYPQGHQYVNGVCRNCGAADPNAPASTTPTPSAPTAPTAPSTPTTPTTPGTASADRSAEEQKAYEAMVAMKSQYPEGTLWTNDNSYSWKGGIYSGGAGCAGFAFMLSDAAFGSLPARKSEQVSFSDVRVGDILRNGGNTHSMIVLEVLSDGVVIAEGNYNNSVHWGRKISRSEVEASSYLITRWPQDGAAGTPSAPSTTAPSNPTTPTAPGTTTANPFSDVPEGTYYHDAVLWALENGITTGVTSTQFQPNATCTRGQVVTFLWRAKGRPEPKTKTNPFTDVSASSPFYKAILWAYENKITSGVTSTTFNPSGTCSSAHVVTFLWRADGKPSMGTSGLSTLYYAEAAVWADSKGLLEGVGGEFVPEQNSPRANIVTYLYRDLAQ